MCLTEIACDIFVCVVGVWQRDFLDLWCVCLVRRTRHTHHRSKKTRCQTPTTPTKISQVISIKHIPTLTGNGPQRIRNMSEFLIVF